MKKAALGLTIALAMGTAIACTPAKQQGTMDNTVSRYNGGAQGYFYQDGTEYLNRYGTNTGERTNTYNTPGTTRDGVGPGLYNNRNTFTRPGGAPLFGGFDGTRMDGARDLRMNGATNLGRNNNVNTNNRSMSTDRNLANSLAQRINDIPGVNDVSVLVHGNDVVIGVDTTSTNVDNLTNRVRREAMNQAGGRQVHVTADRDLYSRINNLSDQQFRGNHPIRSLGNDVQRIIADIGSAVTAPFR